MDSQTLLTNAVGIIGGLASIGTTFDQVLTTDQTRLKISEFLKRSRGMGDQKFFSYLALVNETVFKRFFSAPFFSARYFSTCAVVSLISLLVITVIQVLLFGMPSNDILKPNSTQLILLLVCIFFNVVIDWISIGQTQIFFEVSESQSRFSHAAILIASDFILTINVFTMLYAQPLAYGLYFYSAQPTQVKATAEVVVTELKSDDLMMPTLKRALSLKPDDKLYSTSFDVSLRNASEKDSRYVTRVRVSSNTPDVFLNDIVQLASKRMSISIGPFENYFSTDSEKDEGTKRSITTRTNEDWKKFSADEDSEERSDVELKFPSFGLPRSRGLAYSAAYQNIDQVQDGFPASVLGPMTFLSIGRLNSGYNAFLEDQENPEILGCGTRKNGRIDWVVEGDVTNCEGRLSFSPRTLIKLRGAAQDAASDISASYLPLNTFFMTSLAVTAPLYMAATFLFLARQFYQRIVVGLSSIEHIFLKSPFAFVGLIVGSVLFLGTLVL